MPLLAPFISLAPLGTRGVLYPRPADTFFSGELAAIGTAVSLASPTAVADRKAPATPAAQNFQPANQGLSLLPIGLDEMRSDALP